MPTSSQPDSRARFWTQQTTRMRRTINLACWLEAATLPGCAAAAATGLAIWWLRTTADRTVMTPLCAAGVAACWLAAGWAAQRRAKVGLHDEEAATVRLESLLGLHNALTAARAGVAPWPDVPTPIHLRLRWRLRHLLPPWLVAITIPLLACWLPIAPAASPLKTPLQPPQTWSRIEHQLEQLETQQLAAETSLEETRKQLEQLRAQAPEDWFSHPSLEAGDHLERQLQSETARLAQAMQQAAVALEAASAQAPPAQHAAQAEAFAEAMKKLEQGAIQPNPKLMEQLRQLTPEQMADLDPQQLEALRQQLEQQAQQLAQGGAGGAGDNPGEEGEEEGAGENGEGNPGQEGQPGQPGRGGVDRGPGHDPKWAGKQRDRTAAGQLETIPPRNLSNATPGSLLGLQSSDHPETQSPTTPPVSSGSDFATGSGGNRVWEMPLDPAEQRAVKRFFE